MLDMSSINFATKRRGSLNFSTNYCNSEKSGGGGYKIQALHI